MSKKQLLSEVRRFMKLANVNSGLASNFIKKLDENDAWTQQSLHPAVVQEEEEEEEEYAMDDMEAADELEADAMGDMEPADELEADAMDDMDDMGDMGDMEPAAEPSAEEAISNAVEAISALGDLLGVAMEVESTEAAADEFAMDDMEAADELEADALDDEEAVEETLEEIIDSVLEEEGDKDDDLYEEETATEGTDSQELVNEVLKRVQARLTAMAKNKKRK